MRILIVYESFEGQTSKIAHFVKQHAEAAGHTARLCDAFTAEGLDFSSVDAAILAAPVHERRHPKAFEATLTAHQEDLAARPTLMLSVSLSAAFPEGLEEAREYLQEMEMRTELTPSESALVAGGIHSRKYDYYSSQVLRHVVLRDRDFDPDVEEYEFTDWKALAKKVSGFLQTAEAATEGSKLLP